MCGFVEQPCNTDLKGQSPGSCRPDVAGACTNPAAAAATRSWGVTTVSCCSSCLTTKSRQLAGTVTTSFPSCGEENRVVLRFLVGHPHLLGLLCGVFLLVPFNVTSNRREAGHLSARRCACVPSKHPGCSRWPCLPAPLRANISLPTVVYRKSILKNFYFVNYKSIFHTL